MPSVTTLPPLSSIHMSSGDHSFEKFFEEVIASPEMNLLDDVFAEEMDQKPVIHHLPPPSHSTHSYHPMLHRLQPVPPPPLSILKSHVHPNPTPTSSAGGISPTLTWSGDPSPIDQDASPTLHDSVDLDGEEWKPSSAPSSAGSGGAAPPSLFARPDSRGREGRPVREASQSRSRSSGKRSTRSSSASNSADGGDELTMSTLSILQPVAPGSPGAAAHTPRATASPARKKSRTTSSSRSSISSIDALISEAMGPAPGNRLVPTGHRRNITSASLVPLDAPTQIRNYLTPSSTSKKEIPSAFVARRNKLKAKEGTTSTSPPASSSRPTTGRKRTREEAGLKAEPTEEDTVDQLQDDDTPVDQQSTQSQSQSQSVASPTSPINDVAPDLASESSSLLSAIEAKRRQNTLAARRSRQRKLDYVRNLEELVAALTRERDTWKGRAENAEKVLGYRPADDEMEEDDEEDE